MESAQGGPSGDAVPSSEVPAETRVALHAAVAELGSLAVSGGALDQLLDATVERVVAGLDACAATIVVPVEGRLHVLAMAGLGERRSDAGIDVPFLRDVLEGSDALHVPHRSPGSVPMPKMFDGLDVGATIAAPIRSAGASLGLLTVHTRAGVDPHDEDIHFVQSMANVVAHAFGLEQSGAELARRAITDDLTGLANRALFHDRLRNALARRDSGPVAVVFADLDGFKDVNDAFGHGVGDDLLRSVGRRLAGSLRKGDTIARLGGDEFAILCPEVADEFEAASVAERTLATLEAEPFEIDGPRVRLSASFGVAVGGRGHTPEALLSDADAAMYRAKAAGGRQVCLYDEAMHAAARERFELSNDLRHAIGSDQLVVHFQPEVDLSTGERVWAEALVRWDHPTRGRLTPDMFLDVAERTNLLGLLDAAVFEVAVVELRHWLASGPRAAPTAVSVNITEHHLRDDSLVSRCAALLDETGFDPSSLWLELTEQSLIRDPERVARVLADLSALGVGLSLDDFGTGYSSLSHVGTLPFDALKIDRSFVSGAGAGLANLRIVRAVIDVAHSLGKIAIAEGVETAGQRDELRALGCDFAQGFFISEPLPAAAVGPWTVDWHASRVAGGAEAL